MSLFGREHLNPGIVIHLPLRGTEMHMPRTNASYVTHMHSLQLQAGQCVGRPGAHGWAQSQWELLQPQTLSAVPTQGAILPRLAAHTAGGWCSAKAGTLHSPTSTSSARAFSWTQHAAQDNDPCFEDLICAAFDTCRVLAK